MIRGILFDMDGLMFDTEAIGYRGWKGAGRRLGIRIDDEAIAALRGLGDREKREMFGRMTGRPEEYEKALAVRVDYADQWISENGLPVKPGLKELMEFLKEKRIPAALATSTEREKAMTYLRMAGVEKYFSASVCGREAGASKPAPDIFLKAAEKLGVFPEECIVVEDSENGCKAAKNAGMTCIAYYNPDSGKQDLGSAYMIIEGYEEIDSAFMEKAYCHSHHLPALICETNRLVIREMKKTDIPRLMEICSQETSRDACEGVAKPLSEELEGFDAYRSYMYELCDMGYWSVLKKDTGEIIGRAGVEPKFWNQKKTVVELGYIIDEKYRRQGYAYEACQGIIEEAAKRGAVYLHCRIKSSNKASVNLAEKLGFQKINYHLEEDGDDMEVWRYTC